MVKYGHPHPQRHAIVGAAVDANGYILPWSRVDQWSIRDTYVLFLRTLSKIAYRQSKKKHKKGAPEQT